jgi:hypothetical protein
LSCFLLDLIFFSHVILLSRWMTRYFTSFFWDSQHCPFARSDRFDCVGLFCNMCRFALIYFNSPFLRPIVDLSDVSDSG